ncbi:MAG: glycosyltransferase [Chloroflexota bacterium]|nr:glycosyltransferase [Chloroflexota bacterium]
MQTDGGERRHILFLTPQLPYPPEQGTAIRNYNLIRHVASRYDVAVLTFVHADREGVDLAPLEEICCYLSSVPAPARSLGARLCTLLTTRDPDMAHRLRSATFTSALQEVLAEASPDLVQVEGIELAPYIPMMRRWLGERCPPIVFDDHNAEYVLQRRALESDLPHPRRWQVALYSFVQWRRLLRYERAVCRWADGVVVVSKADARAVRRLLPALSPRVVPNGVDVERYHPQLPDSLPLRHPALVFTGKMDFRPNVDAMVWFYDRVWPLLRAAVPDVQLYVVGKSPHARLSSLANDPAITVTGYVEDILPYFGGADVYIVPLRVGGGTRLKVLEAMAAGLPLVSTSLGAEGIPLISGTHALLADTPTDFAQAVRSLLDDPRRRQSLGNAAREFALQRYDWRQIVPRLYPLYDTLMERRTSSSSVR